MPDGWLWIASEPAAASFNAASTERALPRATTVGRSTQPSSETSATKHTSLPRAREISDRMKSAASGERESSRGITSEDTPKSRERRPRTSTDVYSSRSRSRLRGRVKKCPLLPVDSERRGRNSGVLDPLVGLERLLLRGREQDVVQDQPVSGRMR